MQTQQTQQTQQSFTLAPSYQAQTGEISSTFNLAFIAPDGSNNPVEVNIGTPVNPTVYPDGTAFDSDVAPYMWLCSVEIQGIIPTPGIQCVLYGNEQYALAAAEGYALQVLTAFLSGLQSQTPGNYSMDLSSLTATPAPPSPMVSQLV